MAKKVSAIGIGGLIIGGLPLWRITKPSLVKAEPYSLPEVLANASPGEVGMKYLFPEYLETTYPEPSYAFEPIHREYRFPEEAAYFGGEISYQEYLEGYYKFSLARGF